jgi:hypothetical protein
VRIKQLNPGADGTTKPEDIDRFKREFLDDPEQTAGAYSIIQKEANGKETVLDVFSVRDWAEELKKDQPVIQPNTSPEAEKANDPPQNKQDGNERDPSDSGEGEADRPNILPPDDASDKNASWTPHRSHAGGRWQSRLASAGVMAGALMMIRETAQGQSESLLEMMTHEETAESRGPTGFDRRARRTRRLCK